MNQKCQACGCIDWIFFVEFTDMVGNPRETYRCNHCGHMQTIPKKIEQEEFEKPSS